MLADAPYGARRCRLFVFPRAIRVATHLMAWKYGVSSLYYCRGPCIQRAGNVQRKGGLPGRDGNCGTGRMSLAGGQTEQLRGMPGLPVGAGSHQESTMDGVLVHATSTGRNQAILGRRRSPATFATEQPQAAIQAWHQRRVLAVQP